MIVEPFAKFGKKGDFAKSAEIIGLCWKGGWGE